MEEAKDTRRAWSYNAAVEAGLEPRSYAYTDIPEGTWAARLDFKVWSNKTAGGHLVCYFTSLVDDCRYRLSVFRPRQPAGRFYTPKDGGIDFSQPGLDGQTFLVDVGRTAKGDVSWLGAEFDKQSWRT
ncbi:hypothetical protein [Pseudomonas sp. 10S4]|uniref:hypothetical protein n=1 Tax=Pseudomonas sp. 10S4 TaxID=3048583 RepID=UPI002AC991BC|nr:MULTISPECIES: hypothetical protein [unclassified Pseudomonas]MEB0223607.1 hypothetical protein [Pseudomonas sp. 5S1]MEB0297755.1 hypothetical protein [Pseudomonas sp. 10S4]WPX21047.1 hypothetical protein RHM58_15015 [Pseudomonas sp. 10S4]